jgi:hypothetical protein
MVGGTTLGFVVPPGALLGGFVGGLVGGASYVWSEITD